MAMSAKGTDSRIFRDDATGLQNPRSTFVGQSSPLDGRPTMITTLYLRLASTFSNFVDQRES
jgi:hypothetical protein